MNDGVEMASADDATRFELFFEEQSPLLYRRLCLITGSRQEAEEVMQDAFIALLERWERVRGLEDPEGYLYRTAFRMAHKRWQRAARSLRPSVPSPAPPDLFAEAEDRQVVRAALQTLTRRQRTAIVLTDLLGYSSEDAADVMGVRAVTVRVLASQGRAALRTRLEMRDG